MPVADDSQCTPCLSTLLNENICESCIEREWYLTKRQATDGFWYSKMQFREKLGDQYELRWQQAREWPGGLHPLARDCEWKKHTPCKVTHAPTVESDAVSAPIPWQCGMLRGPVICGWEGMHVVIDGCLHDDYIVNSIVRALKNHGVCGKTGCVVCCQRPREMVLGCGHILTCSACLEKFTHCGICNKPVTRSQKVPDGGSANCMCAEASFAENHSDSERSGSGLLSESDSDHESMPTDL